jgi:hypothetical protein
LNEKCLLQKLRAVPTNVDEFVTLMSDMAATQETFDGYMEKRDYVQDLYLLLAEQKIPITEVERKTLLFAHALSWCIRWRCVGCLRTPVRRMSC